ELATASTGEFRRHLKTCSKLPQEVAPTDKVEVKLRVLMTPDGRLAAAPAVIGGSAAMKGPRLFRSAGEARAHVRGQGAGAGQWRHHGLGFACDHRISRGAVSAGQTMARGSRRPCSCAVDFGRDAFGLHGAAQRMS